MPHVSSSGGGDDLGSEDEVKVFKHEGEEEKISSENLTEDKSDLIDLTESEELVAVDFIPPSPPWWVISVPACVRISFAYNNPPRPPKNPPRRMQDEKGSLAGGSYAATGKASTRSDLSPVFGKVDPTPHTSSFNMGYLVSPYPYPNGAGGPIPVSMVSGPVMLALLLFPSNLACTHGLATDWPGRARRALLFSATTTRPYRVFCPASRSDFGRAPPLLSDRDHAIDL
ncbi:Protein pangolin, isoforms A/H/I [Ooceraea biroi]|uniref:Protein pangolin, isoforms A/H/I n=1 Tax=Ooceraea biroi TaxID=2015173 RepID=A0A026W9U6_OOCBI|nr:Protein pangolin, isoforms A/H/I [Ooceraea biroi]